MHDRNSGTVIDDLQGLLFDGLVIDFDNLRDCMFTNYYDVGMVVYDSGYYLNSDSYTIEPYMTPAEICS